jgi:hypothetical protein
MNLVLIGSLIYGGGCVAVSYLGYKIDESSQPFMHTIDSNFHLLVITFAGNLNLFAQVPTANHS